MTMKLSHHKFVDAMVTSLEDNRVCTYAVAEALLREPVDLQERFIKRQARRRRVSRL